MWFTPIKGRLLLKAMALAVVSPISRAPTRPGPQVAAIASKSFNAAPADSNASSITGLMFSRCFLDATSGTTPPNLLCMSIWLDMMFDRTSRPFLTTAAEVSSHEVSIASINISLFIMRHSLLLFYSQSSNIQISIYFQAPHSISVVF